MKSRTFPALLGLLIAGIAIVNALAIHYAWYWSIRPLDMPMHFLGGLWLAGSALWLRFKSHQPEFFQALAWGFGAALAIGVAWEVYESLVSWVAIGRILDIYDTMSDISFDILGGITASILIVFVGQYNKK